MSGTLLNAQLQCCLQRSVFQNILCSECKEENVLLLHLNQIACEQLQHFRLSGENLKVMQVLTPLSKSVNYIVTPRPGFTLVNNAGYFFFVTLFLHIYLMPNVGRTIPIKSTCVQLTVHKNFSFHQNDDKHVEYKCCQQVLNHHYHL